MAAKPVITHAHTTLPLMTLVNNIRGVSVSTAVTETSHSHYGITLVTTKPQSAHFTIQVFSYSYDGVIHTDSYISDI